MTGASSGIGREFARLLAEEGYDLVLVARRRERLEALAGDLFRAHGTSSLVVDLDLTAAGWAQALHDEVTAAGIHLDVLVNNAGATPEARFLDRSWEEQHGVVEVMAVGPLHLIHLVLPGMLERRHGHIINVASIGAWYASTPTQTLYGAVKAFVLRATETLADEYAGAGVTFTAVCPGVTRTEILEQPVNVRAVEGIPARLIDSPRKVAEQGWKAARAGRTVAVVGPTGKLAHLFLRLMPRAGGRAIAKRLIEVHDLPPTHPEEPA